MRDIGAMGRRDDPCRLLKNVALGAGEGAVAGWLFLVIVIKLDLPGLGILIDASADGALALVLLLAFFAMTIATTGIAWRVMALLPDEED